MKLVIQIPCYNEETSLPVTLAELPRSVPGFDEVEWLVIDDGSTDRTAAVAEENGVDRVVRLPNNRGLARAFVRGLDAAIDMGADVIVNTDADNQYRAEDIPKLVAPILSGKAEIVVGERPISATPHFSPLKKGLQRLGSRIVRKLSATDIPDAPSGFRAISRDAAMRIHVFNTFSYTLETIVQAGRKGMAITSVPVQTNPDLRPSRLYGSLWSYLRRQGLTVVRIFMTYRPFYFFALPGLISFLIGFLIGARFLFFYVMGNGAGHVQSLILAALLLGSGLSLVIVGLITDLIAVNRKMLESISYRLWRLEEKASDSEETEER
ncbi:MAG: glycosyltransferase family 2 protein [Anaerolineales bacterium]|nr:glycosyltransferase family 2 protein [Anaerolineales bacterium]